MAEREGLSTVFKTAAFDHSATSPVGCEAPGAPWNRKERNFTEMFTQKPCLIGC